MIAYYKRVAVYRRGIWEWYGAPIAFRLLGYMEQKGDMIGPPVVVPDREASRVLEDTLAEAVFYHPTSHLRIVQAQRLDAFGEIDLDTIM